MALRCSTPLAAPPPSLSNPALRLSSSSSIFFSTGSRALSARGGVSLVPTRRTRPQTPRRAGECKCLFGLGVPELVVIAGVAALVFGPKKLPEIGKSLGRTVKSFQEAAKEFEAEVKKEEPEAVESVEKPIGAGGEAGAKETPNTTVKENA